MKYSEENPSTSSTNTIFLNSHDIESSRPFKASSLPDEAFSLLGKLAPALVLAPLAPLCVSVPLLNATLHAWGFNCNVSTTPKYVATPTIRDQIIKYANSINPHVSAQFNLVDSSNLRNINLLATKIRGKNGYLVNHHLFDFASGKRIPIAIPIQYTSPVTGKTKLPSPTDILRQLPPPFILLTMSNPTLTAFVTGYY